ncbi:DNA polymerase III subunit delta [Candidatus Termititenax dinenymphae]|uniref:DNA polymerase III subunit delta n=1 Tax=Candidatus Termititenax dinenymphae TaxID=2218523 RepID=A0A388TKH9_9BACT|nr:DNA polymerase III subunit delta [Candidatus Termititenax dinenymphae]
MPDARIYLLGGKENFLLEQAVRVLKQKHVQPSMEAFSLDVIPENEKNVDRLINSLQMIPSFSPSRLVLVYNPFFLKPPRRSKDEENDNPEKQETSALDKNSETLLYSALENLPDGVTVVFVINGTVDQRLKFSKFIQKHGEIRLFEEFKPWEKDKAAAWAIDHLKKKNYTITREAAEFLVETAGLSAGALAGEADKLMLYAADRNKLTLADVKTMSSQGGLNTYDLGEALRRKDLPEALRLLMLLFKDGAAPQMLLGTIASQLRTFLQIKELQGRRVHPSEIASLLKINPWKLEKILLPDLAKHNFAQLKTVYYELQNADYRMKTGQGDAQNTLLCALAGLA